MAVGLFDTGLPTDGVGPETQQIEYDFDSGKIVIKGPFGTYYDPASVNYGQIPSDLIRDEIAETQAIREFLTEALSNQDLTEEEIVDILNEMTGLEATVDQGSEIVWQPVDVTDEIGDVQVQIPDYRAILESMGGGGGGG